MGNIEMKGCLFLKNCKTEKKHSSENTFQMVWELLICIWLHH